MGFVPLLDGPKMPLGTWLRRVSTSLLGSRGAVADGSLERVGVAVDAGGVREGQQGGRMFGREGSAGWVEVAAVVVVVGLMRRWRSGR